MEESPTAALIRPEPTGSASIAVVGRPRPFVDTLEHTLDTKARLTLPAAVRPAFADGGVLMMWKGPCIAVLTDAGFERWIEHIKDVLPSSGYDDPGGHIRYAHSQASPFKPDVQGRFQLADRLRFAAGIDREVTVVGAGSRVELWNPATYGLDLGEFKQNIEFLQGTFDLLRDDA